MVKFKEFYVNKNIDVNFINRTFNKIFLEKESGEVGYYNLPKNSLSILEELKSLNISKEIENIVIIGIGGSSLGIKAINSLLKHKKESRRELFFLENSDPIDISTTLSKLKRENSLFIVISKSGSTIETTSIFKKVIEYFNLNLEGEDRDRILTITDKDSSLSKFSKEYQIREFNIPFNVGGRFSVLSAVGIVPLSLVGYDVKSILEGAEQFLESFFKKEEKHLLEKAYYYYKNSDKYPITLLFSYSNLLENFNKWFVQLWGESLGKVNKKGKSVGLTPIGIIGSIDQHSFLQLLIEGPKDKRVTFIKIEDFENNLTIPNITLKDIEKTDFVNNHTFNRLINSQCDATMESLIKSDVPCDIISIDKLTPKNIGELIIYFELLTSLVGAMFDINTYNQPGVELGKTILAEKF